uniref:class B sortase n=1 Tax=Gemmiger formicilis TaxID=745368 RepID=UPI004029B98D
MKNFLYSLFIGLFGIAGLTSIAFLLMYAAQSKQQAHLYSNLAAVRKQDTQQGIASQSSVQPTSRNLYLENADMIGWIQIEGTSIDYPVMQTPADPHYYLKHDFEKNYTDYGCPFMQADCDALAPSDNLIIYGHNMKDGSMFADLAKYRSKDFWQNHKTVWFATELGSRAYEIFAVIHTTVQADDADAFPFYRFVDAAAPEDFADYVSACQARALYDTGISAEYGDKLLTLSTCDNITDDGRLLVIANQTETE